MSATQVKFTADDIIKAINNPAPRVRIELFSHGIRVSNFGGEIRNELVRFCCDTLGERGNVSVGRGRFERRLVRIYVGTNRERSWFHFHRNNLDLILKRLARINVIERHIEMIEHPMYEPVKVRFPLHDTRPARPEQIPIIEYCGNPPDPRWAPSKVVTLQTGRGKTFLSLHAIRNIGHRTVLVLKGGYIEKWIGDVEEAYGKEKGALMVVRGIPQLRALMGLAQRGELAAKFIIISSKTMQMYLQYYEKHGVDEFLPIKPTDFYKELGVGVRLIDEVHQEFHNNFRQDCYTHVPLTISLSATLEPDSPQLQGFYHMVWPPEMWAPAMEYKKFINVEALWYRFKSLAGLKWTNFMGQYNHTEFEKSIMKKPQLLENYVAMIVDIVEKRFMEVRSPGQKMMIFVATVNFATILSDQLKSLYPHLLINRYVSEDEYEDLVAADISVTTLQSAGTAVDVPDLRVTLMTTSLSSKQANIQVLGRTRELKNWPDIDPDFIFLASRDIDKQIQYANEKKDKLAGKVKSFRDVNTNFEI